ncbi:MAG: recombination mediator RecR [Bacilli bacterium]|jgi:recombination protein RecR
MEPIKTIEDLIACYKLLPGVGYKTAERLAYATMELTEEQRNSFIASFTDCNTKVKKCPLCGTYFDDVCPICSDPKRDKTQLLVVSDSKDILSIEKTKGYNGLYFSLKGTLSPLKNRNPDDIGLPLLKKRVEEDKIKELILALPTDLEGETTSLYIANMYKKNPNVKVSRLAYGIPVGTDLEYLDNLTIAQSIKGRTSYSKEDDKNHD